MYWGKEIFQLQHCQGRNGFEQTYSRSPYGTCCKLAELPIRGVRAFVPAQLLAELLTLCSTVAATWQESTPLLLFRLQFGLRIKCKVARPAVGPSPENRSCFLGCTMV